ncbi:iron uptake transporter deferrochelatase/peroxidase subunit [Aeromicrobium duanguangcaii]|uniref:Deferrochelatase n=1 Tax=Aeromicrobium duanguangcaii TaxID=2968086 RepID=A0ABY5KL96_9ACTN|nr:iron uptake transporter deferrochelatase/peroxidase subunit [Aeromicrobium duanguangcaii]MCD9153048.1 iron uptake transporter deferrochelatase/peroxidase subunit [Aeromicrobium duanguangcaii]UUI69846.1 iron uptake transporter deferrochelatase/peroxidase subunit [Aeromicrobium duanguangcaii]
MTGGRLSRRSALGLIGAAGAVGVTGGFAAGAARDDDAEPQESVVPFHGKHQSGITTRVQQHLYFASFDMTSTATREDLKSLLADWTDAAARLTQGREVTTEGATGGGPYKPPDDTGEALGLEPNALTITFGFGPTLFAADRFGLEKKRPKELVELPSFAFELLEDRFSGGDLCIQACADDPQVAVHAIRNLSRIAFGRAQVRWTQLGYGRTSTTSKSQSTPRNLFGFKDGTANVFSNDDSDLATWVWADGSDQPWLAGGSFLVARKIQMLIESWDRVRLEEQEAIVGRDKGRGAPLSGGSEFTEPDFDVVSTAARGPAIPMDSHVRLAHPTQNGGARMLRRGYNYVEGNNDLGQLNAGLFFLAFVRSPEQFVGVQRSLAKDSLNEYIRHIGSAIFAVPGGIRAGESIGSGLF